MPLDPRSLDKLQGVRPELVGVIKAASEQVKFRVTEGLRSKERQKILVAQRKSKTLNSRHITGHAIDFIAIGEDGVATYDMDDMRRVAEVIKTCATEQGVKIQWGGDWPGAWDSPHCELDRKAYPANAIGTTERAVELAQTKTAVGTVAATGAASISSGAIPIPPLPAPPDLSWLSGWQSFGDTVSSSFGWITSNPLIAVLCAAWVGLAWFAPHILERFGWQSSPSS
jgi:peptidoglycan L-alanyl-D-glutamate endopeptidase CwlK